MFELFGYFMIGLTGGFGHCVIMCNPLVIYVSSRFAIDKNGYSILVPHVFYNLGRILTYSILGALAGFLGGVVQYAGSTFMNIQRSAALIGGCLMIFYALFSFFKIHLKLTKLDYFKYLRKLEPSNPFLYGVLFGFLPCGLSMGAVIGASSSGNFAAGALMMLFFGLGTSVAMMIMAIFGSLTMRHSKMLRNVGLLFIFIMGIYFIYIGLRY